MDVRVLVKTTCGFVLGLAVLMTGGNGFALTFTGDIQLVSRPAGWDQGQFESNDNIFLFAYAYDIVRPADVVRYKPAPGHYDGKGDGSTFSFPTTYVIPAGTVYDYFVLSFDPIGTSTIPTSLSGSITFDYPISVITDDPSVTTSRIYGGLERPDWAEISSDLRTLTVYLSATTHVDQIGIGVNHTAVPLPGAAVLLGSGLTGLLAWSRRKKQ